MNFWFQSLFSNYRLLLLVGLGIILICLTIFISPLIPIVLFALILILLIIKDYRIGTVLIIIFVFSSIQGQEILEAYHINLFVIMLTAFSLVLSHLRGTAKIRSAKEFNLLLLIIGLWSFISAIIVIDHELWYQNIIRIVRVYMIFYLIYNSFTTKQEIFLIFKIIILSLFLSSFISLYVNLGGFSFSFATLLQLFVYRFGGLLIDPNFFAMSVAGVIPLAFVVILKERHLALKIFWTLTILFLMFSIVLSQSRTGIISFSFIFLYATLYLFKRKRKEFWFLALPIVILIILLPSIAWRRFSSFFQAVSTGAVGDTSMVQRLGLLTSALDVFLKNPIVGVGLGNFQVYCAHYTQYPMVAHNTFLEIAAGLGLLGFIPFLLLLYRGVNISKAAFNNPETRELAWAVRAGLLGMYVGLLFLSVPFKPDLWTLLGLSAILGKIYTQSYA